MDIFNNLSSIIDLSESQIYYGFVLLISCICGYCGWSIISILRRIYQNTTSPLIVSLIPIFSPILIYILLNIVIYLLNINYYFDIADAGSFSYMVGILWKLSEHSIGIDTIRLCIHTHDLEEVKEIWLKNSEVKVSEAITMIAKELNVRPGKVSIESGKGKFIDQLDAPLVPLIVDDTVNQDLFGFSTIHCYVTVLREQTPVNLDDLQRRGSLARIIPNIIDHRSAIKYGNEITLSGKIPNAANDAKAFEMNCIENYAVASPQASIVSSSFGHSGDTLRFIGWKDPLTSTDNNNKLVAKFESSLSGQKIHNQDCIVIENEGK